MIPSGMLTPSQTMLTRRHQRLKAGALAPSHQARRRDGRRGGASTAAVASSVAASHCGSDGQYGESPNPGAAGSSSPYGDTASGGYGAVPYPSRVSRDRRGVIGVQHDDSRVSARLPRRRPSLPRSGSPARARYRRVSLSVGDSDTAEATRDRGSPHSRSRRQPPLNRRLVLLLERDEARLPVGSWIMVKSAASRGAVEA